MATTMLLLWGKNDDGQLGSRSTSCGSPYSAKCQSQEKEDDATKVTTQSPTKPMMSKIRPTLEARSSASNPAIRGRSPSDSLAWTTRPSRVLSGLVVLQVSCGSRHTLALVEGGTAYSWGWGACGQLGHGDDHGVASPRVIEALKRGTDGVALGPATWVSAGGIHSAAVVAQNVFTWGGSSYGQLGLGPAVTTLSMQALPGKVMLSETESPLGSPRTSFCYTVLTRHSSMAEKAAVLAMDTAPKVDLFAKIVTCGGMHTAALTEDGVLFCWGRADSGQLGIGTEWVHQTSSGVMGVEWPRRVRGLLEGRRTASVSCGAFHTAAVTTDGECYTWGKEDYGMLGCSNEALLQGGLFRPHLVTLQDTSVEADAAPIEGGSADARPRQQKVKAVACGGWHTAVIGEEGGVWTCGRGEYGRLGLGDQKSQWLLTPVPLRGGLASASSSPARPSSSVSAATTTTPGTTTGARVGAESTVVSPPSATNKSNNNGADGFDGAPGPSSPADLPPPPPSAAGFQGVRTGKDTRAVGPAVPTERATMVALGGSHSLVLTSSGRVFGFGRGEDGRLGMDVTSEELETGCPVPAEISSLQVEGWRVQSISAGGVHSAAILTPQEPA